VTAELEPQWNVSTSKLVEWTIVLEGTPSVRCTVETCASFDPDSSDYLKGAEEAALVATAAHAVNAIPFVVAAPPGVKTFLDLPIVAGRGAFR